MLCSQRCCPAVLWPNAALCLCSVALMDTQLEALHKQNGKRAEQVAALNKKLQEMQAEIHRQAAACCTPLIMLLIPFAASDSGIDRYTDRQWGNSARCKTTSI